MLPWGTYVLDPLQTHYVFCDLIVREKAWRAANQAFEHMHNTLSHRVNPEISDCVDLQCFRAPVTASHFPVKVHAIFVYFRIFMSDSKRDALTFEHSNRMMCLQLRLES